MSRIGTIIGFQGDGTNGVDVIVGNQDDTAPFMGHGSDLIGPIDLTGVTNQAQFETAMYSVINAFATLNGYTFSKINKPFDMDSDVLALIAASTQARSFATPSRTINSAFQISTTRDAMAFYSVSIPTTLSLTGGENGAVVLEYADDSGIATNVVTVGTVRNGNTGTLTLGLNTLASMGCQVSGVIPAGKYARLRPVDTTGSPVQAFVSAQEVLL